MGTSIYARGALLASLVGCSLSADESRSGVDALASEEDEDGSDEQTGETSQALSGASPKVAPGYTLETNCPSLGGLADLPLPSPALRPANMAFDAWGRKLYIAYQSGSGGQVHVRDLVKCSQHVLIHDIDTPLGVAVHPHSGKLYVTHKYTLDPTKPTNLESNVRSAVSIFDAKSGSLVVDKFVKGLPPSNFGPAPVTGNGAQGLTFDAAGNLYIAMNVDVWEEANPGYLGSALLKVDCSGTVSVFASGLRATFDAVVAETNWKGEATAFYATDNGEGDFCNQAGPGCEGRNRASRMYYDELNLAVKGGFYGYPQSAPGVAATETANRNHVGPIYTFEKIVGGPFDNLWPVPTGVTLVHGDWGRVRNPVFVAHWRAGVDMFTGPGHTKRTPLVTNLDQTIDVVVHPSKHVLFISEYNTGLIYMVKPKNKYGFKL